MELKNGCFHLNGKPFFLYAGEVHYFRIPRRHWRARLSALKGAGFNTVSTYIPWLWHEPEEGRVDLTGQSSPERDVLGFLDLAARMKLRVSARVGPVSNAELTHEGLPGWLLTRYPDIFVKGRRDVGTLPHVTMVSYRHPVFLEKTKRWHDRLLPEISCRQTARGGNVLAVQLCNEIGMVHWLQKGADEKDHVNRLHQNFLKDAYGTLEALNQAHRSAWADWGDVRQPVGEHAAPETVARFLDWSLFYRRYFADYFQTLARGARAHGITAPLLCNIPQFYDYDIRGRANWAPMTTSMFRDVALLTPGAVFGGAYQMRHLDFENFHDIALTTEVTRMVSAVHVTDCPAFGTADRLPPTPAFEPLAEAVTPVLCAELQTGILRDRPRLYPAQVDLNLKSSVGQGLAGVNAYMLAGGENPPGMGAFGAYHDWQAPIGPDGDERPHLAPLREFGRFLKWAGPSLAATRKQVDTSLGFYLPYHGTEYWTGPWVESLEAGRTSQWFDGTARLVTLAGFSVRVVDLQRWPVNSVRDCPSLWVHSLDFMDHDTQVRLVEYVANGGVLMLGPRLPCRDLRGAPDTTLADGLGLSIAGERPGNLITHEGKDWWVQGPVQLYSARGDVWLGTPSEAAVVRVRAGRGQALAVGFGMPHVFDHFRHWIRRWSGDMGVSPRVACDPWDLQASLRHNDAFGFLFLFNYHFNERSGAVTLPLPGTGEQVTLPARGRWTLDPLSGVVVPLNLPVRPRVRWTCATAEVRDLSSTARGLTAAMSTAPGRVVEAVWELPRRPRSVTADGQRLKAVWDGRRAAVSFTARRTETNVRVIF